MSTEVKIMRNYRKLGYSIQQIASALDRSPITVRKYVGDITRFGGFLHKI